MANTGVKGRVVDDENKGIEGLKILAVDLDPIYNETILNPDSKPVLTDGNGDFEIRYFEDAYSGWWGERDPDIVVRIYTSDLRLVHESPEFSDVKEAILQAGTFKIHKNNIEGWLVTLATLNPEDGTPVWCTQGNKIEPLIDGAKMFPALTEAVKKAQKCVNLMNFRFGAEGSLISSFNQPFIQPKPGDSPSGEKLQEVMLSKPNVPMRVLVWDMNAEALAAAFATAITSAFSFGFALGAPIVEVILRILFQGGFAGILGAHIAGDLGDSAEEVKHYFRDSHVQTRAFQSVWELMHARVVVIDEAIAFVLGSSISRGYFSDTQHLIRDARHGGSLLHDVSLKVEGPAVEHLDRSFTTVWNQSDSSAPPLKPSTGQAKANASDLAAVQVIRTLPGDTFTAAHTDGTASIPRKIPGKDGIPAGETGVLEAYQRAIAHAEDFIYIEDQYFLCPEITTALINRMNLRTALQLIIVLNVKTDHPDYRNKQVNSIKQLYENITNPERIGVYTLWSTSEPKPKLEVMPITIHSKVAIVDDKWATVGTANADGASMNQTQTVSSIDNLDPVPEWLKFLLFPLVILFQLIVFTAGIFVFRRPSQHANPNSSSHPARFVDLNLAIYNDVEGLPPTNVVTEIRKELWSEHLGLPVQDISQTKPADGWVKLWEKQAKDKCNAINKKAKHAAKVLAWKPEIDHEDYLKALGIKSGFKFRSSADEFIFEKCNWKDDSFTENKCQ